MLRGDEDEPAKLGAIDDLLKLRFYERIVFLVGLQLDLPEGNIGSILAVLYVLRTNEADIGKPPGRPKQKFEGKPLHCTNRP